MAVYRKKRSSDSKLLASKVEANTEYLVIRAYLTQCLFKDLEINSQVTLAANTQATS